MSHEGYARQEWLRRRVGVLREPNFRRFYTGYSTSLLGSAMSTVAIAFAVLDSGARATGLGWVFAASVVPQVLFMPVAGAVADRLGRRRAMLGADVLRCAAQASFAAVLFAGRPPLWLFILLAWLGGTGTAFFTPSLTALTVEMAPAGQLGNANALYSLAGSATRIVGPALGGALVAIAGPATVVAVDAASYLASVLALSLLRLPAAPTPAAPTPAAPAAKRRSLLGDMADGWADFRSRTWLWVTTVQLAFFNLITWAPWMLLGPVLGKEYLGGAAVWGAIMAVQGAGAILAGLLSLGRHPRRPVVVATVGTFCYALPDIPMALHAAAPWVAAAAFACGAGAAVSSTFSGTAMQQQVPPQMLARVSSLMMFPSYGIGVIGYMIDGPLAGAIGTQLVFGVGAAYGLLSSAAVLTLPAIRAVRWRTSDPGQADDAPTADDQAELRASPPSAERRTRRAGRRP
ncbi:MAG: MFS transporter [Streptosporangiaceae bacterium]